MQGYDVVLFIVALVRTETPGGSPPRKPGWAVALATKHSSLVTQLLRHGAAIAYTDLSPVTGLPSGN